MSEDQKFSPAPDDSPAQPADWLTGGRAIVGARTSVTNDSKVSHDAQREAGDAYALTHGMEIVGHFQDLGVSASVSPWERKELGRWLSDEHKDDYDTIVWSKVDRAFRSNQHCSDMAKWAKQNGKALVFAGDNFILDYRGTETADTMLAIQSELFVTMSSFFARIELARFRGRAKDSHGELKTRDRWASGVPPLGFRTIDHPSGHGKTLDRDEYGYDLLHRMARQLLDGWSFTAIANDLNDTGAQTNMDRARSGKEDGKRSGKARWNVDNVRRALTTLRTQGVKMSDDQPVIDKDGNHIRLAPPTFDDATWEQIQSAAGVRKMQGKRRAVSTNPMLGVGYCGECGASVTRKQRREKVYYWCGRTPRSCSKVGVKAEEAHDIMERAMTVTFGSMPVARRVFVPGTDNRTELEQKKKDIARLRRESDAGLITTEADEADYLVRMKALTERRDALAAEPYRPSGYVTEYGERTYADEYQEADEEQRRDILRNSGIRLLLHKGEQRIGIPEEMADVMGTDSLPVSALDEPGWVRLVGNFARAIMRGELPRR